MKSFIEQTWGMILKDVWRREFIAGGALIVALLVGASANTAIVTGKIVAGLIACAANVAVTLLVAVTLFGLRIPIHRWLSLLGIGFLVALSVVGFGLGLGAWLRDYRTLQPLLYVTAAGSFFAAGGYGSVATLPPAVRAFDVFWPPAYVFETIQAIMHIAVLPDLSSVYLALPFAALFGVAFGAWMVRRAM